MDVPDLSGWAIGALAAVAFVAGLVDAVAGGGGLITVPALLAAGLPPHVALATNKGQSVWGSGAALLSYARSGLVRLERTRVMFPAGLFGAALGVCGILVLAYEAPGVLKPLVLGLLVAVAAALALRPRTLQPAAEETYRLRPWTTGLVAFAIGAYDGFFGPGTGTFLILALVTLLGEPLLRATAEAKVVNFASNLASCIAFAAAGLIHWKVALPMAAGQFLGATLGARITVKHGDRVVRWMVFAVVLATCSKLAWDLWRG